MAVINTVTNTVTATIPVGPGPQGIAVTPDGRHVYVSSAFSDDVSVIATATNTVTATVPVGGGPHNVAVTPDGSHAYVTNADSRMSVIDTADNTVTSTITGFSSPYVIAFATVARPSPASPPAARWAPGAYTIGTTRFVVYIGPHGGIWQKQVGSAAPATWVGGRLLSPPPRLTRAGPG